MSRQVFIITSPFQLLNAIEAKAIFKADENILVLKFLDNENTNSQMLTMIQEEKWNAVLCIKRSKIKINFLKDLWLLRQLIRNYKRFDRVFIGDFIPWNIRVFAQNLPCKELILLDDGLATIAVQNTYLTSPNVFLNTQNKPYQKAKIAKYLFGLSGQIKQPVHLFSSFQLKPLPDQIIYKNEFTVIKSNIPNSNNNRMNDTMYIIGSPYVEKNMMRKASYLLLLQQIKEKHHQLKLVYISHRAESKDNLDSIQESLQCTIEQFDTILELAFIKYKIRPAYVCGFSSTALVNLRKLYEDTQVFSYQIELDEMPLHLKERVEEAYKYIEQEGIEVEDLFLNPKREYVI